MQEDSFNINNVGIRLPIDQQGLSLLRHDYSVEYRRGEVDPAYYLSDHPAKHGAETSQLQKVAEEYLCHLTTTSIPIALKTKEIKTATMMTQLGITKSNVPMSTSLSFTF